MRRVLITGSRNLDDWPLMYEALLAQTKIAGGPDKITIVHGGANGADNLASRFCKTFPEIAEEEFPADWGRPCNGNCYHKPRYRNGQRYCPMAGHFRNQAMVDSGADVCLAFPRGEARGTNDCIRRAKKAGIPVILG